MARKKVFLALPVHNEMVLRAYTALDEAVETSQTCAVRRHLMQGESMITRARNRQISAFLRSDCEWYMTLDADIEVLNRTPDDNVFDRLTGWQHGCVGALVSKRGGPAAGGLMFASIPMRPQKVELGGGLMEMRWLGAGVMAVRRDVVEGVRDKYPELAYDGTGGGAGHEEWALYMPIIQKLSNGFRKFLSEDWSFCQRVAECGVPIFADMSIRTFHWGSFPYAMWPQDAAEAEQGVGG